MATMADVARMAGVSTATVSHVLNGTRPVRASTREQVLSAVAATHYTPNTVARSLATARTTTMGLVLSAISNPYFGELLSAAESAAAAAGYTLLLVDPHEDPDYELTVVTRLHHHRVDGVVLAPSAHARTTPWPTSPATRCRRCCSTGSSTPGTTRWVRRTGRPPPGSPATSRTTGTPGSGWWPGLDGLSTTDRAPRGLPRRAARPRPARRPRAGGRRRLRDRSPRAGRRTACSRSTTGRPRSSPATTA